MKKLFISHSAIDVSSYRLRSLVKRIARGEQPRDSISWLFDLRCWLVAAMCSLSVGLAGCGPASSDNTPSLESRSSLGGPPLSKQGPMPGNNPVVPLKQETNLVPLASGSGMSSASGKGTAPVGDSPQAIPVSASKPAAVLEPLVVPAWIAKDLDLRMSAPGSARWISGYRQRLREQTIR